MKRLTSILILIAIIVSIATISNAEEASITLSANKEKLEKGEELKVSIIINNFTREGQQKAVQAKIAYDNQKLEYKQANWGDGWAGIISTDGTAIVATKAEEVGTQENLVEITYVAKENAKAGNTTVAAKEILTSSDGDEVEIADVEKQLEILGKSSFNLILVICIILIIIVIIIIIYNKSKKVKLKKKKN